MNWSTFSLSVLSPYMVIHTTKLSAEHFGELRKNFREGVKAGVQKFFGRKARNKIEPNNH